MARISAPTWLEDTPTRCRVFFSGTGPIQNQPHTLGFFVSPNNNWWIPTLNVSEGRRAIGDGGDFVNIVAGTAMQHFVQPPGAAHANDFPFGAPASFGGAGGVGGPAMNAAAFPRGGSMRNDRRRPRRRARGSLRPYPDGQRARRADHGLSHQLRGRAHCARRAEEGTAEQTAAARMSRGARPRPNGRRRDGTP